MGSVVSFKVFFFLKCPLFRELLCDNLVLVPKVVANKCHGKDKTWTDHRGEADRTFLAHFAER